MTVNLSALGGAGQQFFDNSGNVLTGGKLWSYEAGTTTPQATYTTAAGNVAHTNPIVLDSAGRVPGGEIWLTASDNYKFVLMTSANVTLVTWDNITGINGTGIANNAINVTYDPPFTGGVATNVEAKLAQTVSVKDFGAAGDGVTDDTVAIQDAIDALTNGGTVYFPQGIYAITSGLTLSDNITLSGSAGTTIKATAAMANMVLATDVDNIAINNIKFDANNVVTEYSVKTLGCQYVTIDSNHFVNWKFGLACRSNGTRAGREIDILNNRITDPGTPAIYPLLVSRVSGDADIKRVRVIGNTVIGVAGAYSPTNNCTADQITLQGVDNFIVSDNYSANGGENGMSIVRATRNGIISNNFIANADGHGIQVSSAFFYARLNSGGANFSYPNSPCTAQAGAISLKTDNNFTFLGSSDWWSFDDVTGGKVVVGDTITETSTSITRTVQDVIYSNSIIVVGNIVHNCGRDVDNVNPCSGFYAQQGEDLSFVGNIAYDNNAIQKQQYGLLLAQSERITISANDFLRNDLGDVSSTGVSSISDTYIYGGLVTPKGPSITISAGEINVGSASSYIRVATEGGAASDDLNVMNGAFDGQRLVVCALSTNVVNMIDSNVTNGFRLNAGTDFALNHPDDTIELIYDANVSAWRELSRSNNN